MKRLMNDPTIINHEPYEDGWLVEIEVSHEEEVSSLMDYAEYMELMDAGDFDELQSNSSFLSSTSKFCSLKYLEPLPRDHVV